MKQNNAGSIVKRRGWAKPCPDCGTEIRFTKFTNQQGPVPFFHSSRGKDLLLRRSDRERLDDLYKSIGDSPGPSIHELKLLWEDILSQAPAPPHGGEFTLWANVRCPHCDTEFPYNRGVKNDSVRIHEPAIIVIDGTTVVEDDRCYRVSVKVGEEEA